MRRFLIITNTDKDKDFAVTNQIKSYLEKCHCETSLCTDIYDEAYLQEDGEKKIEGEFEAAIVLGGDGTILRACRVLRQKEVPILGVNLGTVGFLAEIEPEFVMEALQFVVEGNYKCEERMLLEGNVYHEDKLVFRSFALNEIVVSRSGFSRIIELKLTAGDELLDVYEADGVIVSTPTGSTGYNLSAGGPIVSPKTSLILVTPILSHSLISRSIVLSSEEEIIIEVGRVRKTQLEEAVATFDGQMGQELSPLDKVVIRKAKETVRLIHFGNVSFYEIVRNKLYGRKTLGNGGRKNREE